MRTDSKKLFEYGIALALDTWRDAAGEFDWAGEIDWFVAHQTSTVHLRAMADALGVDPQRFPVDGGDVREHGSGRRALHPGQERRTGCAPASGSCCWASARG